MEIYRKNDAYETTSLNPHRKKPSVWPGHRLGPAGVDAGGVGLPGGSKIGAAERGTIHGKTMESHMKMWENPWENHGKQCEKCGKAIGTCGKTV